MAVGKITTPATWLLGTVLAPSWAQNVQDDINALLNGGVTAAGLTIDGTGGATVAGKPSQITVSGASPSVAAGAAAGSGAIASLGWGNDTSGSITLTTGTSPLASGTLCTLTWATPRINNNWTIILSNGGGASTNFQAIGAPSSSGTTLSTNLIVTGTALAASSIYFIHYFVVGY